jgi:hypothetical protein
MVMTETTTLTQEDFCRHKPHCERNKWIYATVPDYQTYFKAHHWLREERKYQLIFVEGGEGDAFRFKFLCEQEYILFVLKWS